jgi:hypothetical protein
MTTVLHRLPMFLCPRSERFVAKRFVGSFRPLWEINARLDAMFWRLPTFQTSTDQPLVDDG